ncbi:glycosyltransferase family 2 protein [Dubosiella newyorkensis]|uniref:glycosyltransferase family 2 protein n=1 Tax=Dubosiella newyorkensis TaxID=1862672 RepID=UPI00272C0BFD|nr:glycosyltransferase family 2 protein [Dubosiella newyorkensis]
MDTLVTVVVPFYNVEKYIESCMNSIVNQTYKNLEIILVNDGSKDHSRSLVEKYLKDKRVKIIDQVNMGIGEARNSGLIHANGEYILFVDSDDKLELNMIEKLLNTAKMKDLDLVICGYKRVNERFEELEKDSIHLQEDKIYYPTKDKSVLLTDPSAWGKLYKTKLFKESGICFPNRVWAEDLQTIPKIIALSRKIGYIKDPLYYYVQHSGSIMSSKTLDRQKESLEAMNDLIDYFKENNLDKIYAKELEFLCIAHIYVFGINCLARIPKSKAMILEFRKYINNHFPDFHKNPYLSNFTPKERKFYDWIDHDQIWKIQLGDRIKREVKKWKKH